MESAKAVPPEEPSKEKDPIEKFDSDGKSVKSGQREQIGFQTL